MLFTTAISTTSDETSPLLYVAVLIVFQNSLKQWFHLIDYSENKITERNEFYHIRLGFRGITNEEKKPMFLE